MEYDGTHYYGLQLQANLPTIQGEIETALGKLTGERSRVPSTFIHGLNHYLPADIAVKDACSVKNSFNVRHHAISREYNYYILNSPTRSPIWCNFAYHVVQPLNIEAMNQACQTLIGEHDFASFATSIENRVKSTVRQMYQAEVVRNGDLVVFNIVASSFLAHQVRNTTRRPGLAGPTVPACGLCLMRVNYPHPWEEMRN
jgi:tRNA pseudouridine38-40 synthase